MIANRNRTRLSHAICLALSLSIPALAFAAPPVPAAGAQAPASAAGAAKSAFVNDFLSRLDEAQKKLLSLEEAVPQNKFKWRPAPGVRSISEAYLHVAFGNYVTIKSALGKEPPADAGWEMNVAKWDTRTTDKAEIKAALEKSFAHVHESVKGLSDADLDKKFNFFGTQMTVRAGLMQIIEHVNEHLGQSIAYARSNKVTPPWSNK